MAVLPGDFNRVRIVVGTQRDTAIVRTDEEAAKRVMTTHASQCGQRGYRQIKGR
jgi:hypothetical protein